MKRSKKIQRKADNVRFFDSAAEAALLRELEREAARSRLLTEALREARNDYQTLRGRVLRRLREEVSLLDEGLMALRKDPPRVDVMDDHADRALDGLKKEIRWLLSLGDA